MMRLGHCLAAASAVLAAGPVLGWSVGQTLLSIPVAMLVAPLPDVDNRRWWQRMDRWLPDEWLGHGGPLRHRGITHWWGVPLAGAAAIIAAPVGWVGAWLGMVAVVAWSSHIAADFLWGKACPQQGRGPGVPLAPWWGYVGLGWDVGGRWERVVVFGLPVLIGWQGWVMVHG